MGFSLPWAHGYTPSFTEVEGTELEYEAGVLERGRGRLLHQFRGKPRLESLLGAILAPLQETHVATWQLLAERTIDSARFEQLRVLARTVGIRGYDSREDPALRRLIRAWILALRSSGTSDELIRITVAFTGSEEMALEPEYPAGLVIYFTEILTTAEAGLLGLVLRKAAAAGVRLTLIYVPQLLENTFTFSSSNSVSISTDRGFGDAVVGDIGGGFAGAIA
jgi:hypothetical protein